MITRDRELISVLEDKRQALGSNPRPLKPLSFMLLINVDDI